MIPEKLMNFTALHYSVTLALACFVVVSGFCRIANIDMKGVQYRYVAPFVLFFFWALFVAMTLLGGDKPDWYQPLGLLAVAVYLWNTKVDWKRGMPKHYKRDALLPHRTARQRLVTVENVIIGGLAVVSMGVVGVGAADGRGDPLQIYSAYAKPPVVAPGDTLEIIYSFRRVRVCPGYTSRFIVDANSNEVVQSMEPAPVGGSATGQKLVGVPVAIKLNPDLEPGRYVYRSVVYSNCEDAAYTKQTPDVPFVIDLK